MLLGHADLQVNILPYYRYADVSRRSTLLSLCCCSKMIYKLTFYLTTVMLLSQDDLQVDHDIFPKCRCAAVSIFSTFQNFLNYRYAAVSRWSTS